MLTLALLLLFLPSGEIEDQGNASEDHKSAKDLAHGECAHEESDLSIRLSQELNNKTEQPIQADKEGKQRAFWEFPLFE